MSYCPFVGGLPGRQGGKERSTQVGTIRFLLSSCKCMGERGARIKMAASVPFPSNCHRVRSTSLPSRSHPISYKVYLPSVTCINPSLQLPQAQQALAHFEQVLDGYVRLLAGCLSHRKGSHVTDDRGSQR
ncbi:hypothetical protein H6P81_019013 [Aristolochia fimbriata]|uniref:Uncharacterized protein n=1 Tax=Aristolochia fimbriata TaxID=158543 RepID=A0AAV7E3S2_ARIFI|nr:hypothetical protein H6P81_019013 [Aristolochia fimbriata]